MKYIIIEIQKNDGGNISHIVKTADTEREAESIYHGTLQYAALSELPCHSVVLMDETGFCIKRECYTTEEESE